MKGDGHNLAKREHDAFAMLAMAVVMLAVAAGVLWLVLQLVAAVQSYQTMRG